MPMNPDIKAQWTAALRSGEYPKTTGTLRTEDGFCCLGVLCDLAVKAGEIDEPVTKDRGLQTHQVYYEYDGEPSVLSTPVRNWAGLDMSNPDIPYQESMRDAVWRSRGHVSLAELNDNDYTFPQIADLIDANL